MAALNALGAERAQSSGPINEKGHGMPRVLLVDDDSRVIDLFTRVLTSAGHEILSAFAGRDAVAKATGFDPDIAFVDLVLPDISGIEVTRTVREILPRTVCIIISGH